MMLEIALRHRFAGFDLDVAFQAPPGLTALFGRSGSGKTTIVNAVAGLLRPDQGRIVADGAVLLDTGAGVFVPPHRRRVGYVFQDARLFPHLTVRQNLMYGRWFAPRGPGADLAQIVEMLGIGPLLGRRPGALSGGERQRVALGRAILSNPRLLLMDEPLAALDEARKAEILPYLERLRDELRLPVLYVSHSAAEVARLATTVVLIGAGRVQASGPAGAILSDPAMAPAFGLREAGAILTARIAAQEGDGLTRLDTGAGPLWLPRVAGGPGTPVRLRILAQDVLLATVRPEGISALNILSVTVREIRSGDGPGALVALSAGDDVILARITRRSAERLQLTQGQSIHAVLKAVAVAPGDVGRG
ncbi:MAG: molybdenum ABC transporter ATP-binding protein [Rhodobacterales bacterium]|nr:molybdenum ABC transporter ATP-binding protein [Rhodobacterales bacterium]MDX5500219.1 molybdenum ABC transporter ATP-binding protein [Rhodobacterales bacterium]